eukprot:365647-Chlamydomonas_euryale.AAC.20
MTRVHDVRHAPAGVHAVVAAAKAMDGVRNNEVNDNTLQRQTHYLGMQCACVLHRVYICMRGPERLPLRETEAGWSVHKTCVEAAGRGLSRLLRPRPA